MPVGYPLRLHGSNSRRIKPAYLVGDNIGHRFHFMKWIGGGQSGHYCA